MGYRWIYGLSLELWGYRWIYENHYRKHTEPTSVLKISSALADFILAKARISLYNGIEMITVAESVLRDKAINKKRKYGA